CFRCRRYVHKLSRPTKKYNRGVMRLIFLTDYEGNQYPLIAVKKISQELNGNHSIELDIPQQKNNRLDLKTIDKLWTINYKQVDYKIIIIKQITKGDSFH